MPDLRDGESYFIKGSAAKPYEIKNIGGLYSCSCPAWRNQSLPIERRTCKHIRQLRGDEAEEARIGGAVPVRKPAGIAEGAEVEGPPVLLAESWENDADLTGWWMSEKLDGVRAYWDGKQFLSRQGNLYVAPDWFIAGLPNIPLDGELWIGRKLFQRTVSVVRRQDKSDFWKEVRFLLFDAPGEKGAFEKRMALVQDIIRQQKPPYALAHGHEQCKGIDHLKQELARVEGLGGEGLMMRKPGSVYEVGRSATLLKVKRFHDAEARVLGHLEGAGKHKGRLGALSVELPDGTRFSVGTGFSDKERENPPPVGSVISFRYQELSDGGVPRFPSFVGVRLDASTKGPTPGLKGQTPAASIKAPAGKGLPTFGASSKAASSKAAAPAPAETKEEWPRCFEYTEGGASKFWEVTVRGCEVTTRWGKIGSTGQSKAKTFDEETAALVHATKLIDEKMREGYDEV